MELKLKEIFTIAHVGLASEPTFQAQLESQCLTVVVSDLNGQISFVFIIGTPFRIISVYTDMLIIE